VRLEAEQPLAFGQRCAAAVRHDQRPTLGIVDFGCHTGSEPDGFIEKQFVESIPAQPVSGLRQTAVNMTQDGINAMDNFVKTS